MPMTWRVGDRVRPRAGSKERTYVVQKVVVIRRHNIIWNRGIHLYTIKDLKTGKLQRVRAELLIRV